MSDSLRCQATSAYFARRASQVELTPEDAAILSRDVGRALIGMRDDRLGFAQARYQIKTRMWRERRRARAGVYL